MIGLAFTGRDLLPEQKLKGRYLCCAQGKLLETITVPVDYGATLERSNEAISFCEIAEDINSENCPSTRKGVHEEEIQIWDFLGNPYGRINNWLIAENSSSSVRRCFTEVRGLQALAAHRPDLMDDFPKVAFGSLWHKRPDSLKDPRRFSFLEKYPGGFAFVSDWLRFFPSLGSTRFRVLVTVIK